jgi:predicted Rossmann-fold nucleotide-binding protein
VASGEAVIAVGGEWGTLAEIGFARKLGREVVALRSWRPAGEGRMEDAPGIVSAASAEEAVAAALADRD